MLVAHDTIPEPPRPKTPRRVHFSTVKLVSEGVAAVDDGGAGLLR